MAHVRMCPHLNRLMDLARRQVVCMRNEIKAPSARRPAAGNIIHDIDCRSQREHHLKH